MNLWRTLTTLGLLCFAATTFAQDDTDSTKIFLNAGVIDTASADAPEPAGMKPLAVTDNVTTEARLWLVQIDGDVTPEKYKALQADGSQVVCYIPNNAYLVYGQLPALNTIRAKNTLGGAVRYNCEFKPEWKFSAPTVPTVGTWSAKSATTATAASDETTAAARLWSVQMVADDAANTATLELAGGANAVRRLWHIGPYCNATLEMTQALAQSLTQRSDVVSVMPWIEPKRRDERQNQIMAGNVTTQGGLTGPGYWTWLNSKGFTQAQFDASDFAVDICDSGVDNGTLSPGHFALRKGASTTGASRVVYSRLEGTANKNSTLVGADGHGTINAHIVAGNVTQTATQHQDAAGYKYGLGVCPYVQVGASTVFDPSSWTNPNLPNMLSRAYRDKARISNNSWGADNAGGYDSDSQSYDYLVRDACPSGAAYPLTGNQPMVVLVAAGNAGPGSKTVGSPATAKNVISVGASNNVHPFGATDGCAIGDNDASDWRGVSSFSSRGPCTDGRIKPDVMAPGTHVTGGVAQTDTPDPSGTGSAHAKFLADGGGVCGGINQSLFFPNGQQWNTASSGTSHATPAVAGAAALMRQWFINKGWAAPSPAMTKAWMGISTRLLNNTDSSLMTNNQGMGLIALDKAFNDKTLYFRDQEIADMFTETGQERVFEMMADDPLSTVEVTLAWTDAPGSTVGNAWNNNLDLVVEADAAYLGNNFNGELSAKTGTLTADVKNNMESVRIAAGYTGKIKIRVKGTSINSDGVPGNGISLDQDFALIARNVKAFAGKMLVVGSVTPIQPVSGIPANTAAPYRPVTASVVIENTGNAAFTNIRGTMRSNTGVSPVNGSFTIASLAPGTSAPAVVQFAGLGIPGDTVMTEWDVTTAEGDTYLLQKPVSLGMKRTVSIPWTGSVAIPDNGSVDVPINVTESGRITATRFSFDGTSCNTTAGSPTVGLTHSYVGDLVATLLSPDATACIMFSKIGGGGHNICNMKLDDAASLSVSTLVLSNAPFTGTYSPFQAFSVFTDKQSAGMWILRLQDIANLDKGTVQAVTLTLDLWEQIPPDTSTVSCTIEPADARTAGAQWSIDGGTTWRNSGTTATDVEIGSHTVTFKTLTGWNTPAAQIINVQKDIETVVSATYTRQYGSVQVSLAPALAVTEGAQWSVNNGATWNNSDATQSNVAVGSYTLTFRSVTGWNSPAAQAISVSNSAVTSATGTYTMQTGSLLVILSPMEANNAGAQWSYDGGATWNNSGTAVSGMRVGNYTVVFKDVDGYNTPTSQTATVTQDYTTTLSGTYTVHTGSVSCTIEPATARNAGAQWSINGGSTWYYSGATVGAVPVGTATVMFNSINGWDTPADQTVTVTKGNITPVTAMYLQTRPTGVIPTEGTGTSIDPYIIRTLLNLVWISDQAALDGNLTAGIYYVLGNDIDAAESASWNDPGTTDNMKEGFLPIGMTATRPFRGHFDGKGKTISWLSVNRGVVNTVMPCYIGLFGLIQDGSVTHLNLTAASVTGFNPEATAGQPATGTLAGAGGNIDRCSATGIVSGDTNVGGLIGQATGPVSQSRALVTVQGRNRVGGFVGQTIDDASVQDCYAFSDVSASTDLPTIGGFIGNAQSGSVTRCYSTSAVNVSPTAATTAVGGFSGSATDNVISDCYWDTTTSKRTTNGCGGATGKTTELMRKTATFANWDFASVWAQDARYNYGYPSLTALGADKTVGALRVTLTPATAVTAGAMWSADDGFTWNISGTTQENLPAATTATLTFKTLSCWDAPTTMGVYVNLNLTATATAAYVQQVGAVTAQITGPTTAKWRVNGGTWQSNSAVLEGVSLGTHTVEFADVLGWQTPATQTVQVTQSNTSFVYATYIQLVTRNMTLIGSDFTAGTVTPLSPGAKVDISWGVKSNELTSERFWCEVFASKTGGFDQVRFGSTVTNSYRQTGLQTLTQVIAPANQTLTTLPDGVYTLIPVINRGSLPDTSRVAELNYVDNWTAIPGKRMAVRNPTTPTVDLQMTEATFAKDATNPNKVTVTGRVKNVGTTALASPGCWIEVFYGTLTAEATLDPLGTISVGQLLNTLGVNEETTFSLTGYVTAGVDNRALAAIVDSTDIIPETNEVNNSKLWYQPAILPSGVNNGVDLTITAMSVDAAQLAPNQVKPGDKLKMNVTVQNKGTSTPTEKIWLEVFASQDGGVSFMRGATATTGDRVTVPAAGASKTYTLEQTLNAIGDGMYTLVPVINRTGVSSNPGDMTPTDNRKPYAAGRISLSTPSITGIQNITWLNPPTFTRTGTRMTITGTLTNTGNVATRSFWVEAFAGKLDSLTGWYTREGTIASGMLCNRLAPGATQAISISGNVAADKVVGILADSTDLVAETDETDNYDYSSLTQ